MSRVEQGPASRGSQKWLQVLVNEHTQLADDLVGALLKIAQAESVRWLSPLKDDGYAEYRDQSFTERLGVSLDNVPLKAFWPKNGPQWDGLATTAQGDVIIVEAKSHIPELVTDATGAQGKSLEKIRDSLDSTKRFVGSHSEADWSTCFYQYATRLAHLYFLRVVNKLPAYLLLVYFINDREKDGPSTRSEWEGAIRLMETFLGIRETHALSEYVLKAYVDVEDLAA